MGRPLKFKTPEELEQKIEAYFKACDEHTRKEYDPKTRTQVDVPDPLPYNITGLALALDTSREGLIHYEKGQSIGEHITVDEETGKRFFDAIRKAKLRCQNYAENSLWKPKIATGIIFNLVNNYGWKDRKEVEQSGKITHTHVSDLPDDELNRLAAAGTGGIVEA